MAQRKLEVIIAGDPRGAISAMDKVEGRASHMGSKLTRIGATIAKGLALGGVAVAGAVALGAKYAYDQALESQKISRETTRVIKTTGGAAKVTAKQVGELATSISNLTGVDDEAIQSSENLLLTFTNIRNQVGKGNDIFTRATALTLDMSKALGTDLRSATIQVGKALNDPIKGITALTRAGVSFTQDQKDLVKWLVASGDTLDAQKIILGELGKEFGGAAKAAAGPLDRLKVQLGNIAENIGGYLIPWVKKAADWLSVQLPRAILYAIAAFRYFTGAAKDNGGQIARWSIDARKAADAVVAAFKAIRDGIAASVDWITQTAVPAVKNFARDMQDAWQKFVAWFQANILPTIISVTDQVVAKWNQLVAWVQKNWPAIQEAITHVVNAIRDVIVVVVGAIVVWWRAFGDTILANAKAIWDAIYQVIKIAINLVRGIIEVTVALINGDWGKAWDAIKATFARVWGSIPNILGAALSVVRNVLMAALNTWKSLVSNAIGGIVSLFHNIGQLIRNALGNISSYLTAPFRAAIEAIRSLWNSTIGRNIHIPGIGPFKGADFHGPRLASGGTAVVAGAALVGERGPEILQMPKGASVVPLGKQGRTVTVNNVFHITEAKDARSTARQIEAIFRSERAMAGATAPAS